MNRTGHKCAICGETEGFFHAFETRQVIERGLAPEACESCAEEYGCSCGCFPSVTKRTFAEFMGVDLERSENGVWVYTE